MKFTKLILMVMAGTALFADPGTYAAPLDVSDDAVIEFLDHQFQFDYTTVVDDSTLSLLINAVDHELAMINYRRVMELTDFDSVSPLNRNFTPRLDERHDILLHDGFLYKKFSEWRDKTQNPVSRAYIEMFINDRKNLVELPQLRAEVSQSGQRIGNRLYSYIFRIGDRNYSVDDVGRLVASGDNRELAAQLMSMMNDSVALLVPDAKKLYQQYNSMGQQLGKPSWQAFLLAPFGFEYSDWGKIAENLKGVTDPIYKECYAAVSEESEYANPPVYEINRLVNRDAVIPDSFFTAAKSETAVNVLIKQLGFENTIDRLKIRQIDHEQPSALAVYRYPPDDILLFRSPADGFGYYYMLVTETARAMAWVCADTALPYMLRSYPPGCDKLLSDLFMALAVDSAFLAENFGIPGAILHDFTINFHRLATVQMRNVVEHSLFDYYLGTAREQDPVTLYWRLEKELFNVDDSSFLWIDILVNRQFDNYAYQLAQIYLRIKLHEILRSQFGVDYLEDKRVGPFLIDAFCLPGRTQRLGDFVKKYSDEILNVDEAAKQLR